MFSRPHNLCAKGKMFQAHINSIVVMRRRLTFRPRAKRPPAFTTYFIITFSYLYTHTYVIATLVRTARDRFIRPPTRRMYRRKTPPGGSYVVIRIFSGVFFPFFFFYSRTTLPSTGLSRGQFLEIIRWPRVPDVRYRCTCARGFD